jgi:hypothetical protein
MPRPSKPALTDLTAEVMLSDAFERLRPRLLAMIERRLSPGLAVRVPPGQGPVAGPEPETR